MNKYFKKINYEVSCESICLGERRWLTGCWMSALRRLLAELFDEGVCAEGLGSLDWQAEGAGPDQLREHAESAWHAEHHRIIIHLLQTVILQNQILILIASE